MTRDEIMKLEGRELDAAVAVHVMGWELIDENDFRGAIWYDGDSPKCYHRQLCFSSDIAAAWPVVEKMAAPELTKTANGDRWRCVANRYRSGHPLMAIAATAPEAISRAALLAVLT